MLILGLGLVLGVVEELLVVDDVKINFEEAFGLGQVMVRLGLEGLVEIEESLLRNGVSFIFEESSNDGIGVFQGAGGFIQSEVNVGKQRYGNKNSEKVSHDYA